MANTDVWEIFNAFAVHYFWNASQLNDESCVDDDVDVNTNFNWINKVKTKLLSYILSLNVCVCVCATLFSQLFTFHRQATLAFYEQSFKSIAVAQPYTCGVFSLLLLLVFISWKEVCQRRQANLVRTIAWKFAYFMTSSVFMIFCSFLFFVFCLTVRPFTQCLIITSVWKLFSVIFFNRNVFLLITSCLDSTNLKQPIKISKKIQLTEEWIHTYKRKTDTQNEEIHLNFPERRTRKMNENKNCGNSFI